MIKIDTRSSKPIYEQIVDGIKESIFKGKLKPGQKIPSVREMSKHLSVNPNTVSKAYAELERKKVIDTISGRGTFVSSDYIPDVDQGRLSQIKCSIKDIVIEAYYIGLNKKKILDLVEEIFDEMGREQDD